MSLQEFETLLKQNVGIDATALGRAAIDRAVRERAAACALPDWAGYLEHLRGSEDEMQALSDAIIQPEERFFRDRSAYEALSRLAVQGWLTASHGEQLRLLSVGCGGGEEPYSMTIELLEAGFPADRLRIDAVDISAGALVRARQGVYSRLALEPADARVVERHFLPLSDGLRLDSRVRNVVTFFRANVLADNFLASTPEYDFIFCRQLLIYLDEPTQNRLVRSLYRALARQGVVFVGAGETAAIRKPDFVPIDIPGVSAFLKAGKRRVGEATETARAMGGSTSIPATASTRAPVIPTRTPLDLAAKLAQRGQWADVTRLCESYIREQGECADAFFLLGEVQRAAGQADGARWHYERALQLRPEHTMASLRLAQLPPLARESGSALRRAGYLPRLQP